MRGSGSRVPPVSGDKRQPAPAIVMSSGGGETERCPRCGSQNTKFCYYNNYNLSQPRHFCKACRRYWTVGGTLRNVPVGGSTRRAGQTHNKQHASSGSVSTASSTSRRRLAPAPVPASASVSPSSSSSSSPPVTSLAFDAHSVAPLAASAKAEPATTDEAASMDAVRCFESLLTEPLQAGFLALGEPFLGGREGFDLGLGLGVGGPVEIIDEIGFGIGKAATAWPFFGDDDGSVLANGGGTSLGGVGGGIERERNPWQVVAGGAELVGNDGGDCFGWPELSISSMPGQGLQ